MSSSTGKVHTTIRMTVVTVFVVATALTAAVAIGLQYYFSQSMARDNAAELYTATAGGITSELSGIGRVNANVIALLSQNPALPDPEREAAQIKVFAEVLQINPLYYGIYLGRGDGSFLEVVNLNNSEQARRKMLAMPSDRWLVITMQDGPRGRERHYEYLDQNLRLRASRSEPSDFDTATRHWYTAAMATADTVTSSPYLFAHLGVPGRTVSRAIAGSDTVVAIDMTLGSISEFLSRHKIPGHGDIYLYDRDGQVIASSLLHRSAQTEVPIPDLTLTPDERKFLSELPPLTVSNELDWPPFDYAQSGTPRGYSVDVMQLIASTLGLQLRFINGFTWPELVAKFQSGELDILQSVLLADDNRDWGLPGIPYADLPYGLVTRRDSRPITDLAQLASLPLPLAIPSGWSVLPVVRENYPELDILEVDTTLDALRAVLEGTATAALDSLDILHYLARHYYLEELQFHEAPAIAGADLPAKMHALLQPDQQRLRALFDRSIAAMSPTQYKYLERHWLAPAVDEVAADSATVPTRIMLDIAADPQQHGVLTSANINGEAYVIYGAPAGPLDSNPLFVGIITPEAAVLAPMLDKVYLSLLLTGGLLVLLLPLCWFFANPIVNPVRQLADENEKVRRREFDAVQRIPSRVKELDELSESMVEMVAAIRDYEQAQRDLMDSFIQLIAEAIDEKSPYTGRHCERVPELALMLARHASDSDDPAFSDFRLQTEEEWREYRIAAWLHDCGKITTPEHIVDKGSKLETIYNRIHEIRMRFEVLWRDAEIQFLKQSATQPNAREALERELRKTRQQLQEDYDFVAECNVGGEYLGDEQRARLRALAETTWQRHFDDRIGLSPIEELRLQGPATNLPATEKLLADKPEHIIERTRSTDYDPALGINMDIPKYLYNQGEIYNLSISRGTLTDEDRFKINEHMISTIRMLERLPFPGELKNVPRYASTHHETMRGSGYPRKLRGDQLSVPERILAVADVFEALTAADRPYKKAKPVSAAIDILHRMVEDNHLDRDCFELFLREGVYREYAEQFLEPEQIDEVDVSRYVTA